MNASHSIQNADVRNVSFWEKSGADDAAAILPVRGFQPSGPQSGSAWFRDSSKSGYRSPPSGDTGLRLTSSSTNQTNGSNPFTCAVNSGTCSNAFYTLTLTPVNTAGAPPTFSITATAIGQQVGDGDLTLDYQGNKTRKLTSSGSDQGW